MLGDLRQVGLLRPQDLIDQIDADTTERHQGRAQWIRNGCVAFLTDPDASRNADLIDEIEVVDQRAREVVSDLIRRVEALESDRPSGAEPFSGAPPSRHAQQGPQLSRGATEGWW